MQAGDRIGGLLSVVSRRSGRRTAGGGKERHLVDGDEASVTTGLDAGPTGQLLDQSIEDDLGAAGTSAGERRIVRGGMARLAVGVRKEALSSATVAVGAPVEH